ncbi:MAG: hypothetical protein KKB50_13715 [Planctomycetes bacterium]|nr:hypothetical protein [Planctomycetota bacterium]
MAGNADTGDTEQAAKKRLPKTAIIITIVAVAEAACFFAAINLFGAGPEPTYGNTGEHVIEGEEAGTPAGSSEVTLLSRFKVPNNKSGRTLIYDFDISVMVPTERQTEMEELADTRKDELADRVAQIVRGAEPRELAEDDLRTLRLKLCRAFNQIAGDDRLIERVLIPRCVPMRGD